MTRAMRVSRLAGFLTLCIIGLSASAARAELGARWRVGGANVTTSLKAQLQITEVETLPATGVKEVALLVRVGLSKVKFLCTEMKLVNTLLLENGGALGKVHYAGCIMKINGITSGVCKPHSPGAAEGLIETKFLNGLVVLHTEEGGKKVDLLEVKPSEGTLFAILEYGKEGGSECAIESGCVCGVAFLQTSPVGEILEELVTHLFQEGPLTKVAVYPFNTSVATLDGSAKVALIGAHTGLKWSGIPS